MERNRIGQKPLKKTRKNENTFKDILVNEDNDDVIIPISATYDEVVLHIGFGKKTGVSIEKPDNNKGKEHSTSGEHTTRQFMEEHFIEDIKKSQSRKKKHRGGRNRGKRVESAKTREKKTVPDTEEGSYLSLDCDERSSERITNILKAKPATSNVASENNLQDKTEENTAETDHINKSMSTDFKAKSAVRNLPIKSKIPSQDILTNPPAFSSTSNLVFENLLGTKRPDQSRSLASTCYKRSITNVSKTFSEAAKGSVAPSHLGLQSIMTHPDVVLIVSEMGQHFNSTTSNMSDDSRPSGPGREAAEKYVRSEVARKAVSLQTTEDKVSENTILTKLLIKNKGPHIDESHTFHEDLIMKRNLEDEIAGTKDKKETTASDVISNYSTDIVYENLDGSKYFDQAISQPVVSTAISCKRETAVTTMTRPVDQVVSLLNNADKLEDKTETEVQPPPKSPRASMDIKRELKMPKEGFENQCAILTNGVRSLPNTEAIEGSENEVDTGCDASELISTISSITLTGSPSGNMTYDTTATTQNDSRLLKHSECNEVHAHVATETTESSSEFSDERAEAVARDLTASFRIAPSSHGNLSCDQVSVVSEETISVGKASKISDTRNALRASELTQETGDTARETSAGTATQETFERTTQATADTETQVDAVTTTQVIADTAAHATFDTATQANSDTATRATSGAKTQATSDTETQAKDGTPTHAIVDTATQATADTPTQATTGATTQATSVSTTQATAGVSTRDTAGTATKATAETATKATSGIALQTSEGRTAQATAGTATQVTAGTAIQSLVEIATQATACTTTQCTTDPSTQVNSGTATQATSGTEIQIISSTEIQTTAGIGTQASAGIAAQADVSLSDIVTNLSNETDDDDGDDDAFGIMGIFRKSDLHSPVNTPHGD